MEQKRTWKVIAIIVNYAARRQRRIWLEAWAGGINFRSNIMSEQPEEPVEDDDDKEEGGTGGYEDHEETADEAEEVLK